MGFGREKQDLDPDSQPDVSLAPDESDQECGESLFGQDFSCQKIKNRESDK
jgi:hypothetical protein